jgi:hypothetical protein
VEDSTPTWTAVDKNDSGRIIAADILAIVLAEAGNPGCFGPFFIPIWSLEDPCISGGHYRPSVSPSRKLFD